jgi:ABC-type nitrate/sulfonate/bicarbonate transport system substrate-binding protein
MFHKLLLAALLSLLAGALFAACGDDDDNDDGGNGATSTSTEAATATTPIVEGSVSLALDWTPNTNHTGFYVAQQEGYYEQAGVDLEILPYATTLPDVLVGTGEANCGISFQDSVVTSRATGLPIVSVMAILQHTATDIAFRADDESITRPADLDGKTYAGFGLPYEVPVIEAVIKDDGGEGEFDTVTLDTLAYEAVYSGDADFVISFLAWEGVEAELRGTPLEGFKFSDYGVPDFYNVVMICNPDWLADNPDLARQFVGATVRGFEFAAANPLGAAQILMEANPGAFENPDLVTRSAEILAREFYMDENLKFGTQTLEMWTGYSRFLYEAGILADENGDPLTEEPDYEAMFTNDYLP